MSGYRDEFREQRCTRCSAIFRFPAELDAHMRQVHTGAGTGINPRANPGMKKTGASLREELREEARRRQDLEKQNAHLRGLIGRLERDLDEHRLTVDKLMRERMTAIIWQKEQAEQREVAQAMTSAVDAFDDATLEAMGLSRDDLLSRIPDVPPPEPIVLKMEEDAHPARSSPPDRDSAEWLEAVVNPAVSSMQSAARATKQFGSHVHASMQGVHGMQATSMILDEMAMAAQVRKHDEEELRILRAMGERS